MFLGPSSALPNLSDFFDLSKVQIADLRDWGGEVIICPLKEGVNCQKALELLANDLALFIRKELGKGYSATKVGYEYEWLVREPGHQSYGLKLFPEGRKIIISRVAILEDETIFRRYYEYLKEPPAPPLDQK